MNDADDPTRDDDPFRALGGPVRSAASSLSPPTGRQAQERSRQRRSRSMAAASLALVVVLLGGVGLANRSGDRELTAAGEPTGGPAGTGVGGTVIGTMPGTVVFVPDPDGDPHPVPPVATVPTTAAGPVEPAPTTTTTTAEEAVATTTTTEPTIERLEGTYTGIGHFALGGACPDLTQDLATVWSATDGSTWSYHSDYCAATDADDVWRGSGPFTITAPDGSTLTGDFQSEAQLPTDGEPYGIEITGGTGRYEGAAGSCAITIQLTEIAPWTQQNTGTFSCGIYPHGIDAPGSIG